MKHIYIWISRRQVQAAITVHFRMDNNFTFINNQIKI